MGNFFNQPTNPKLDRKRKLVENSDPDLIESKRAKETNPLYPPFRQELDETTHPKEKDPLPKAKLDETEKEDLNDMLPNPEFDETNVAKENDLPSRSGIDETMKHLENDLLSCTVLYDPQKARKTHEIEENERLHNSNLDETKKIKLNALFEEIVTKASVDYNKQEIQDIQTAVHKMLHRIVTRVNGRCVFNISRIEPCGSMAEQTSVWKYLYNQEEHCDELNTEFDILAVLANSPKTLRDRDCGVCVMVSKPPVSVKAIESLYHKNEIAYWRRDNERDLCDGLFKREINTCLFSDCHCFSVVLDYNRFISPFCGFSYKSSAEHKSDYSCFKCVVVLPTGILSVNDSEVIGRGRRSNCSLMFRWTSKAQTLSVSDKLLQKNSQIINSLSIHVDFLPALEILKARQGKAAREHDFFLVPKDCKVCKGSNWRKSNCMAETAYIVNEMSEKHRKSYKIIKYYHATFIRPVAGLGAIRRRKALFEQSFTKLLKENVTSIDGYHVKTAILKHSRDCSDSSEDYANCVLKVFTDREHAYRTKVLHSFHDSGVNVFASTYIEFISDCGWLLQQINERLCSVTNTDSCSTLFTGERK